MLAVSGLCLFASLTVGQSWPTVTDQSLDVLPTVELSLAPPSRPLSNISAEIGSMDKQREALEEAMMNKARHAAQVSLVSAKDKISAVVSRVLRSIDDAVKMPSNPVSLNTLLSQPRRSGNALTQTRKLSFLSHRSHSDTAPSTFRVTVPMDTLPEPHVSPKLVALGQEQLDSEKLMFEQAISELDGLAEFVASELETQLRRKVFGSTENMGLHSRATHVKRTSFLQEVQHRGLAAQSVPQKVNVKVVPSDITFPTVASLMEDMQKRRAVSETLAQRQLAMLKLDVLEAANALAKEAVVKFAEVLSLRYGH